MSTLMRRMIMQMTGGDEGMTISALPYSVTLQTTRTQNTAINRPHYKTNTIFAFSRTNISSSSPVTMQNLATDGKHIWFNASAGTTLKYDGETMEFVKDGTDFMVTIPDGFDGTIPIVLS